MLKVSQKSFYALLVNLASRSDTISCGITQSGYVLIDWWMLKVSQKSFHALLVNLASRSDTISCGIPQSGYT